ncbi:regulator [Yersinia enterocolitica]
MTDIERIDSMLNLLKSMKSDLKKLKKFSSMDYRNMTPKQCQKRNADADWIAMENIRRKHELHALSVELGFADHRGSDGYPEIELTNGWQRYKYQPRIPFKRYI